MKNTLKYEMCCAIFHAQASLSIYGYHIEEYIHIHANIIRIHILGKIFFGKGIWCFFFLVIKKILIKNG